MKKRRIEIAVLAALILLAAGERPAFPDMPAMTVSVGDLAPQRIADVRDVGLVAVKLLVDWIGRGD